MDTGSLRGELLCCTSMGFLTVHLMVSTCLHGVSTCAGVFFPDRCLTWRGSRCGEVGWAYSAIPLELQRHQVRRRFVGGETVGVASVALVQPAQVLEQRRCPQVHGPQTLRHLPLNSTAAHAMVQEHQLTVTSREVRTKLIPRISLRAGVH